MKPLIVVGHLGYHEASITFPILARLEHEGVEYKRVGEQLWYFPPDQYDMRQESWYTEPDILSNCAGIFFLDFWYPAAVPIVYQAFNRGERVPMVGLYHGSTHIEGDILATMPGAAQFEDFMFSVLDALVIPNTWLLDILPPHGKYRVIGFPIDEQLRIMQQEKPPSKRVVYTSRWSHDKGNDRFVEFARIAKMYGIECIATGEGEAEGIQFTGWLDRNSDAFLQLADGGGYVWGAARQETWNYAALDMLSLGLQPLFHSERNYDQLRVSPRHRFSSYDEAIQIVMEQREENTCHWNNFLLDNECNSRHIADLLIEVFS